MTKAETTERLGAVIEDIEQKIALAREADAEIERDRKRHAFGAATGDADAKAKLATIGAEKAKLADDLVTLEAALAEATSRYGAAEKAERQAARIAEIRETQKRGAAAVESAKKVDAALTAAAAAFQGYVDSVEAAMQPGILQEPDRRDGFSGSGNDVRAAALGIGNVRGACRATGLDRFVANGTEFTHYAATPLVDVARRAMELPSHVRRFLREVGEEA